MPKWDRIWDRIYLQKVKPLIDLIRTIDVYIYRYNHERIKLTLGGYSLYNID